MAKKEISDYYRTCPFPKPVDKRKKKKVNGYKDKHKRRCYYCGTYGAERHEVYGNSNRQISIDNGFQVDLCRDCHREMQENITTRAKERNEFWRQKSTRIRYRIQSWATVWRTNSRNNGNNCYQLPVLTKAIIEIVMAAIDKILSIKTGSQIRNFKRCS